MEDESEEKLLDSNGVWGKVSVDQRSNLDSALKFHTSIASSTIERCDASTIGQEPEFLRFNIDADDETMEDKASLFDELLRQRIAKVKRVSADVSEQLQALK